MKRVFNRISTGMRRRLARRQYDRVILALGKQVEQNAPAPKSRPVVLFNASTRLGALSLNAAYALLAGWSLRLEGVPVVQFVCNSGLHPCVIGADREHPQKPPPCAECLRQSRVLFTASDARYFAYQADAGLAQALKSLTIDELMDFSYQGMPLGKLVLPALRWILRRQHLLDDETTHYLYRQYILSAWSLANQFGRLLDEVNPLAVVVFNGQFYPEAAARWVAWQRGLRVISHEVGLQPYTGFFTTGDATAYPIEIPADFELNVEQNARLDQYLEARLQGNFSMAGIRFWPEIRSLGDDFWQRAGQFRQVVPVFTNVIFDTSQDHANVIFEHMFAWLDLILDLIRQHPETYFVIRAHPDEGRPGKESRESVADWVRQSGADRLPNVLFVASSEYFSSYELIQRSKFVMVYNSTIGMEAALMGAAVLCGGKARFTQLPTVFFPSSSEAYHRQAEEFLNAETIVVPEIFRQNARRFLYYQLFRTSLPFEPFLREDGYWRGYVALKPLTWENLRANASPTLRVVVDGILHDRPFLLEE